MDCDKDRQIDDRRCEQLSNFTEAITVWNVAGWRRGVHLAVNRANVASHDRRGTEGARIVRHRLVHVYRSAILAGREPERHFHRATARSLQLDL